MKRRTPKPWPLAQLYAKCWAGPTVWVAIFELAVERGSPIVTPTRKELVQRTGISRFKTISDALTALTLARWIDRFLVRVTAKKGGVATLLKIALRYGGQQATAIRRTRMRGSRRPYSKGQQPPPDFPKGKGASYSPAPLPSGRGGADTPPKAQAKTKKQETTSPEPDETLVPIAELLKGAGCG